MKRISNIIEFILLCVMALAFWIAVIGISEGCNNINDFFETNTMTE